MRALLLTGALNTRDQGLIAGLAAGAVISAAIGVWRLVRAVRQRSDGDNNRRLFHVRLVMGAHAILLYPVIIALFLTLGGVAAFAAWLVGLVVEGWGQTEEKPDAGRSLFSRVSERRFK